LLPFSALIARPCMLSSLAKALLTAPPCCGFLFLLHPHHCFTRLSASVASPCMHAPPVVVRALRTLPSEAL
jgi:hypothetical protein